MIIQRKFRQIPSEAQATLEEPEGALRRKRGRPCPSPWAKDSSGE